MSVLEMRNSVAVLPGRHGVAEATHPKKASYATPQSHPNENMNFGT